MDSCRCFIVLVIFIASQRCSLAQEEHFEAAFQGQCSYPDVPCQHLCRNHSPRTFECSCREGFILEHNGYSCSTVSSDQNDVVPPTPTFKTDLTTKSPRITTFIPSKQPKSPCSSSPCSGGGLCVADGIHSYRCLCPLGRKGKQCEEHVLITKPKFNKTSYAMLPIPKGWHAIMEIRLTFKADTENGLILFVGEDLQMSRDFFILELLDGYANIKIRVNEANAVIQSQYKVPLGDVVNLRTGFREDEIFLQVAGEDKLATVIQDFNGHTLRATENIFLGGLPDYSSVLDDRMTSIYGFSGCLLDFSINGKDFPLQPLPYGNILQGVNIDQCSVSTEGACSVTGCLNGGDCVIAADGVAKCDCPIEFIGERCEIAWNMEIPMFNGTAFIKFPVTDVFPRHVMDLQLSFRPSKVADGVLFWIGAEADPAFRDSLLVRLNNGSLEAILDLGDGPTVVRSRSLLQPEKWYKARFRRTDRLMELTLGDHDRIERLYSGSFTLFDQPSPFFYIGGTEEATSLLGRSFTGCIDLSKSTFLRRTLKLSKAVAAENLETCQST